MSKPSALAPDTIWVVRLKSQDGPIHQICSSQDELLRADSGTGLALVFAKYRKLGEGPVDWAPGHCIVCGCQTIMRNRIGKFACMAHMAWANGEVET